MTTNRRTIPMTDPEWSRILWEQAGLPRRPGRVARWCHRCRARVWWQVRWWGRHD
jgi:hypothetical protein